MTTFTTDNIDRLQAMPLGGLGPAGADGWEITFHSLNEGLCHQLYVNGQLADWTDTPAQRHFTIDGEIDPLEVGVAAVAPDERAIDLSKLLPAGVGEPTWRYTAAVLRDIHHRPGDSVVVMGDGATGEGPSQQLASLPIWPDWASRWAFGEDAFSEGGFGYDGRRAPGLGVGLFGAGMFGLGVEAITIDAMLVEEGAHEIVLRTLAADGQYADGEAVSVSSAPPPQAVAAIAVTDYDDATDTLTLEIESD